jgi:hypothetical protein
MSWRAVSGYAATLLPDDVQPAQVVVCERKGWWAAGLRRELGPGGPGVRETRTLEDLCDVLRRSPASFAVVELSTGNLERVVGWLVRLGSDSPLLRVAVVADPSLAACEELVCEAGAIHFTCSLRQMGPLAETIRRHVRSAPGPRWSLVQRIWTELPWGEAGGTSGFPA